MNNCYVFIGPSGSGKTSLAEAIFQPEQKIVTYTTRLPRKNEINQKDYYFVTKKIFEEMIKKNEFVEWDEYAENSYGSSKAEIQKKLAMGDCYTILTADGFWALHATFGQAILPVFVTISKHKLSERFVKRGDSTKEIEKRLSLFEQDKKELDKLEKLPQLIVLSNDGNLEEAKRQFLKQIKAGEGK